MNILGEETLNMKRLVRQDQRGDERVRSELSEDDPIIFWIRLQLCGVDGFLQDSVAGRS